MLSERGGEHVCSLFCPRTLVLGDRDVRVALPLRAGGEAHDTPRAPKKNAQSRRAPPGEASWRRVALKLVCVCVCVCVVCALEGRLSQLDRTGPGSADRTRSRTDEIRCTVYSRTSMAVSDSRLFNLQVQIAIFIRDNCFRGGRRSAQTDILPYLEGH